MSVKYLVSGGEGALGKIIVSLLLERGEKVRVLASELSDTSIYRGNPNIEVVYGISTDKDSMKEFFDLEDPRSAILFHTDEYISLTDKTNLTMRRVNVIGAENVADGGGCVYGPVEVAGCGRPAPAVARAAHRDVDAWI